MKRFILTPLAQEDLEQIKSFLTDKAGPAVARKVLREIRENVALLGAEPDMGHLRVLHGMRNIEDLLNI